MISKSAAFQKLKDYISTKMRMSHVYQPAMIRALLNGGGSANIENIAAALLREDQSQIEYYCHRVKSMVGPVLGRNGIVNPVRSGRKIVGYELADIEALTDIEKAELVSLCDAKLENYIEKRGGEIWAHRTPAEGYVPGTVRYEILKRAHYRCELCGVSAEEKALQVDHIVPRARGGSDDISNFQALCYSCNATKRDRDDTDFRAMAESYHHREASCVFCDIDEQRIVSENELAVAILDGYPVTEGHTLIIPKRHVSSYFDLHQPELNAVQRLLQEQKSLLTTNDPEITGYNVGVNCGSDAGQTIFHCHIHLIPRRKGDTPNPRGGVRGVIPDRQYYDPTKPPK